MFEEIKFVYPTAWSSYDDFLENNLAENITRPIILIAEIYPGIVRALSNKNAKLRSMLNSVDSSEHRIGVNIQWVKYTPAMKTLLDMGGIKAFLPVFSSLADQLSVCEDLKRSIVKLNNPTQQDLTQIEAISWSLFDMVKVCKAQDLTNSLDFLRNVEEIDHVLELVYRSLYEKIPLPLDFWEPQNLKSHFLTNKPLLFYIDCLKFSIFSIHSQNKQAKESLLTSDFYTSSNWDALNKATSLAQEAIIGMILEDPNPELKLGLIFDLYYRFKEYLFLREILRKIINYTTKSTDLVSKYKSMIDFLFKLMIHYIDDVDMNIDVLK